MTIAAAHRRMSSGAVRGTRVRAGNAMAGTRRELLAATTQLVAERGTRLTMVDVANLAGVAKATLYNHFRTKTELFAGLAAAEIERIGTRVRAADGLRSALVLFAAELARHPVLVALRVQEPQTLVRLVSDFGAVTVAIDSCLADFELADAELDVISRWLLSIAITPGNAPDADAVATLLAASMGK